MNAPAPSMRRPAVARALCLAASLIAAASLPVFAAGEGMATVERSRYLMGTLCNARVDAATRASAIRAAEAALEEIARVEDVLSTWRDDTELARVNAAAARASDTADPRSVAVSPELRRLIHEALVHARRTDGAFDPVVGALVDAWDLRGAGRVPDRAALSSALRASGHELLRLDASGLRLSNPRAWIDPGGIGKGQGLDAASRVLRALGIDGAVLDCGGQLAVVGHGGAPVESAIADPRERLRPALGVRLADASLATSAQSERRLEIDGREVGHVLDPRTGRPIADVASVSVLSSSAAEADALATALLVMGRRGAARWLAERPGIAAARLEPSARSAGGLRAFVTPAFRVALARDPSCEVLPWNVSAIPLEP